MSKITIKRTVTLKRTVTVRQQIRTNFHSSIPIYSKTQSLPAQNTTVPFKSLSSSTPGIQISRLPSGVYSSYVENYYEQLAKRSKSAETANETLYDVFISHASEDKKEFVQPLVEALQEAGIRVWYDSIEMEWGKSLRTQIDNGIRKSKYAIIVLSKHFFAKKWPLRELDGILAKEELTGSVPLPIWYNVTKDDVYEFSPSLAGIFSMSSSEHSIGDICQAFKLILEKETISCK